MSDKILTENSIHEIIRSTVQKIYDETGIQVKDIYVNWPHISPKEMKSYKISSINIMTITDKD